jgi:hypothetical protein
MKDSGCPVGLPLPGPARARIFASLEKDPDSPQRHKEHKEDRREEIEFRRETLRRRF